MLLEIVLVQSGPVNGDGQ